MIDALFGSKTRVKLLHLFLNNPGQSFYVREITRKIEEQINSVRRELSNMMAIGIIVSDSADNKLYYQVNEEYEFYTALRAIFADDFSLPKEKSKAVTQSREDSPLESLLKKLPGLRVAVASGRLVVGSNAKVDLLLVGALSAKQVAAVTGEIERLEGKELRYSVLPYDEFYYRLSIRDRFITDVINGKHAVLVDEDNIIHA